ncbi:MAG: hypothetical protein CK534_07715 [Nitrospirae bacterium]|nr:MAG: hypothetical protein CK534_07715 [Nitrospirota bacterium]
MIEVPRPQQSCWHFWVVRQPVEEVVEEGKEVVNSKKAVLREAFDVGGEAMKRECDRLRGEERS